MSESARMYSTSGVASRLEVSTNTVQRYGLAWEKARGEALPHLPGIGRLYGEEVVKSLERAKAWLDAHPEETIDTALKAVLGALETPQASPEALTLEDLVSTLHDSISHAMMTLLSEIDGLKEQLDALEREQRAVQALLQRRLLSAGSHAGEDAQEGTGEGESAQDLPPPAPQLGAAKRRKKSSWAFSPNANRLRVPKPRPVSWQAEAALAEPGAKESAPEQDLEHGASDDPATGVVGDMINGVESSRVTGVTSDGEFGGDTGSDGADMGSDRESLEDDGASDSDDDDDGDNGDDDRNDDSADKTQEEREAQGFIGWFKRNF